MHVSYTYPHIHVKKRKSITAWCEVGKCETLPPESPDLSAYTSGYLRTVSKGRGGEKEKKALKKDKGQN